MKRYEIENWSTKEVVFIDAVGWEIIKYEHMFYLDHEGKIITCCFSANRWDIRGIEDIPIK